MKHWAIFYRRSAEGGFTDVLGDRGLIRINARLSRDNMHRVARAECSHRGFDGYRLARGDNLLDLFILSASVIPVCEARA